MPYVMQAEAAWAERVKGAKAPALVFFKGPGTEPTILSGHKLNIEAAIQENQWQVYAMPGAKARIAVQHLLKGPLYASQELGPQPKLSCCCLSAASTLPSCQACLHRVKVQGHTPLHVSAGRACPRLCHSSCARL